MQPRMDMRWCSMIRVIVMSLDRLKADFVSMVSHELRTPLADGGRCNNHVDESRTDHDA
jgi:K+-sensing histidine kinase KdpD